MIIYDKLVANHEVIVQRIIAYIALVPMVICSIWLAVLLMPQDSMPMPSNCSTSISATVDCASSPDHTLHLLAHRMAGIIPDRNPLGLDQQSLLKLLTPVGFLGLFALLLTDPSLVEVLRRLVRFKALLSHIALRRFRRWSVIFLDLYPSFTH